MSVALISVVAMAQPPGVLNGRWNLIFELPDSQPYSQVIMPFELAADPNNNVTAIALGGPGISLSEGRFMPGQLEMKGKSVFGPITLEATVTGNRLQGHWKAASFKGEVRGERLESRSSKESRMAVFDEVWSQVNRQFYDPHFNGVDWKVVAARYRARIESSSTDGQMLVVIREMLKELNSSHVGFYALSPEEALTARSSTNAAGNDKSAPITWKKLTEQVGYLRVERFDEGADAVHLVDQGFGTIGNSPWLIIDLRGNPGGTLSVAMRLGDYIFRESRVVGFLATREGLKHYHVETIDRLRVEDLPVYAGHNVGEFFEALRKTGAVALRTGAQGRTPFSGRIVMLMDERSASTAEGLLSMVKEAKIATLIGRRTAGALLSAKDIKVTGGWTLRIPEADFRTVGGVNVEGCGVEPDIVVDKRDGEDVELKRALEFIRSR
ncbi:MAG: carboxyl-terminal processing protease [Acidobacteriota bacterium]|nr:carboxyl-terminal processing protease [Acidobacteriota bacterium]